MPIVFNAIDDPYGIRQAGSVLGQALMQKNLEKLRNQRQIQSEQRLDARQLGIEERGQQRKIEDEKRKIAIQAEQNEKLSPYLGELGKLLGLEENELSGLQTAIKSGAPVDVDSILSNAVKTKLEREKMASQQQIRKKPSIVGSAMQKEAASIISNAPKVMQMGDDIKRLRELSHNFEGLGGYIKDYLGKDGAAEFNALGLTIMEPVLKIFNPVGALPQQKIELVKKKYAVTASDTMEQIEGKIAAAERFQQMAARKVEKINDLLEEYGSFEEVPDSAWLKYNKEAEREIDSLIKEPLSSSNASPSQVGSTVDKLPSAKGMEGAEYEDDKGQVYRSNGVKWEKVK